MSTLVFLGRGQPGPARSGDGRRVVRWEEHLASDDTDAVDEAAMAWTKAWGARPVRDGRSVRELLSWKGVSLWWFAELYLFHSTEAPRYVRTIETFHRILEAERPAEVEAEGLPADEGLLLERTCAARGVLFHGHQAPPSLRLALRTRLTSLRARWNGVKTTLTALKTGAAPAAQRGDASKRNVLFLSHAAFWRRRIGRETAEAEAYEHYFDGLIPGVTGHPDLRPVVLAVGPPDAFRRRSRGARLRDWTRLRAEEGPYIGVNRYTDRAVVRETRRAVGQAREAWRALRGSPGMREAFSHRGVAFDDLAAPDLAATLLLQLPWAVRSYEEVAAALREWQPACLVLYAESSGWGRAALAACRAAGVPTVALQHGIVYPKYYSYRHGPGEEGCPRPDRTAVFGQAALRLLVEMGGYDPASLVVTGSPRFDDLLASARGRDRQAARARLGAGADDRLVVVASRYRGIRSTNPAIGPAFPRLVRALEEMTDVVAVVKPHPAEGAEAYRADLGGARRVRLAAPGDDLRELLHAADALVTVESLSAVEALVLGRPVVILQMPTNLRALVDEGVALGVPAGTDPTEALRRVLFDPATREALQAARRRYLSEVAAGVDGGATDRILALIAATAGAAPGGDRPAGGGVVG